MTTCSGKEFQIRGTAAGKARLPTVDSLTDGTTKRLVTANDDWGLLVKEAKPLVVVS